MIDSIRRWWLSRQYNKPRYSQADFTRVCIQREQALMAETSQHFRDMRLQLAEKENIINELKANEGAKSKPKRVQRRKQPRKGG